MELRRRVPQREEQVLQSVCQGRRGGAEEESQGPKGVGCGLPGSEEAKENRDQRNPAIVLPLFSVSCWSSSSPTSLLFKTGGLPGLPALGPGALLLAECGMDLPPVCPLPPAFLSSLPAHCLHEPAGLTLHPVVWEWGGPCGALGRLGHWGKLLLQGLNPTLCV